MRKLKGFRVNRNVLKKVYVSLMENILLCNISVWYRHLTLTNKNKMARMVEAAGRVVGDLHSTAVHRKALSTTV